MSNFALRKSWRKLFYSKDFYSILKLLSYQRKVNNLTYELSKIGSRRYWNIKNLIQPKVYDLSESNTGKKAVNRASYNLLDAMERQRYKQYSIKI